jgi:hypothetical protein
MSDTEVRALLAELAAQRRHVTGALDGLTEEQLSTPVPPTTWQPAAVVHHLALDVERWWFQALVSGDQQARRYFDEHPGGAWAVPPGTDVGALYRAECARSDAIVGAADLDARPARWPDFLGPVQTVREIVLHVITETATHAGQLDIVRESIDGNTWLVLD